MSDLIDRQAAIDALYYWEMCYTWDEHCREDRDLPYIVSPSKVIDGLPSAQPEIIRCKDCKYHGYNECLHEFGLIAALDNHYCSYAERREE